MSTYLQVSKLAKCLATAGESTHEGLDLVMNTLMGLEIAQLSKGLVTSRVRAFVGSLSCMLPLMSLVLGENRKNRVNIISLR